MTNPGISTSTPHHTHYTRRELKQRVREVLGRELTDAQLAKARSAAERPVRPGRMRLTAGMPPPDQADPRRRWRANQVEAWLASHPMFYLRQCEEELAQALRDEPARSSDAVGAARQQGLAWSQIAEVVAEVEGRPITRQAVEQRYG